MLQSPHAVPGTVPIAVSRRTAAGEELIPVAQVGDVHDEGTVWKPDGGREVAAVA